MCVHLHISNRANHTNKSLNIKKWIWLFPEIEKRTPETDRPLPNNSLTPPAFSIVLMFWNKKVAKQVININCLLILYLYFQPPTHQDSHKRRASIMVTIEKWKIIPQNRNRIISVRMVRLCVWWGWWCICNSWELRCWSLQL